MTSIAYINFSNDANRDEHVGKNSKYVRDFENQYIDALYEGADVQMTKVWRFFIRQT